MAALKEGRIRKPVVAWVSGTCAKLFKSEVQFGHAGAKSGGQMESAQASAIPRHQTQIDPSLSVAVGTEAAANLPTRQYYSLIALSESALCP